MPDLYNEITSNAFNFSNNYDSNVDQRTGLYNVTLKIGYLYSAGDLRTQLMINYNPLVNDNVGFGEGWALNLSHYDRKNKRVRLSDGSSFNVISTAGGRLELRYFKDGCTQTEFKNNKLTIIYKDGTREEFDQNGYLERIISPSGHFQSFTFRSGRLEKITDTEGKSIKLEYRNNGFEIIDVNGNTLTDGRLQSGHLYRFNFGIDHALILEYRYISGLAFIEEVTHPTGKIEKLYYDPRGIQLLITRRQNIFHLFHDLK